MIRAGMPAERGPQGKWQIDPRTAARWTKAQSAAATARRREADADPIRTRLHVARSRLDDLRRRLLDRSLVRTGNHDQWMAEQLEPFRAALESMPVDLANAIASTTTPAERVERLDVELRRVLAAIPGTRRDPEEIAHNAAQELEPLPDWTPPERPADDDESATAAYDHALSMLRLVEARIASIQRSSRWANQADDLAMYVYTLAAESVPALRDPMREALELAVSRLRSVELDDRTRQIAMQERLRLALHRERATLAGMDPKEIEHAYSHKWGPDRICIICDASAETPHRCVYSSRWRCGCGASGCEAGDGYSHRFGNDHTRACDRCAEPAPTRDACRGCPDCRMLHPELAT